MISIQKKPTRVWFLSRGCRLCPLDMTGGKVLWANGKDGFFLSAYGTKQKPCYGPAHRRKGWSANNKRRGFRHPQMINYGAVTSHRLMAATYADEPCPIYYDSKGRPYKGIVHHVIENPYDFRVDNLLWWLTYRQHVVADRRRRILEKNLPDMYCVQTSYLKRLQDPRLTSDEDFAQEIERLKTHNP